uniref:(northern house mosquito) hypothetical protein n=1 Tax=Culex pipiens TaxID=7175 RepID=A0A8D8IRE2_CULPI
MISCLISSSPKRLSCIGSRSSLMEITVSFSGMIEYRGSSSTEQSGFKSSGSRLISVCCPSICPGMSKPEMSTFMVSNYIRMIRRINRNNNFIIYKIIFALKRSVSGFRSSR